MAMPHKKSRSRRSQRILDLIAVVALLVILVCALRAFVPWDRIRAWRERKRNCPATVTTEFRGARYEATVDDGYVTLGPGGTPVFYGLVTGEQAVKAIPCPDWRSLKPVPTNCRILDYRGEDLLVDGTVLHVGDAKLFLAPGAIIENATYGRYAVFLPYLVPPSRSLTYILGFGKTIQIQSDGSFKEVGRKERKATKRPSLKDMVKEMKDIWENGVPPAF